MSSQIVSESDTTQTRSSTIHVLGTGVIGCYIAATLKFYGHDVTLSLRTQSRWNEFSDKKKTSIAYCRENQVLHIISGFKAFYHKRQHRVSSHHLAHRLHQSNQLHCQTHYLPNDHTLAAKWLQHSRRAPRQSRVKKDTSHNMSSSELKLSSPF